MVVAALFLLVKLYQYAGFRGYFPAGLTVAGVDVGGMTAEEAADRLSSRFIDAPITVYHSGEPFDISPTQAEFTLDWETMLSQAEYQTSRQDFWAGFWGFMWGRPVEVDPVPLSATHDREALSEVLEDLSVLMDRPAQPPQPVPATLSFQYGESGIKTNIEASLDDIEAALYRPSAREAHLVIEPQEPVRPEINLLTRLVVNHLQDFEQQTGGVASVFILDLRTGEEISINADEAMSGMSLLKIPIVLETYRMMDGRLTLSQQQLISDTLVARPDHLSANQLLNVVAGQDDPYLGAELITESLNRLGLTNSFMVAPFDEDGRPGNRTVETAANSGEDLRTRPSPQMQTTAEDIGMLLSMIYYCAQGQGGTLLAVFPDEITQAECQSMIGYMRSNKIGSLIEEGVPSDTVVAHRHGWISDTHGDAGIVFSPGGDYVIAEFLYKPDWLEWEISSPLLADISHATYNFFNFDDPYLNDSRAN
jgi:beta-lactamase class A